MEQELVNSDQNTEYNSELFVTKTKQFANRFRKANLKNEEELNIINVQFEKFKDQFAIEEKNMLKDIKKI